ncbi:hypothetical protein NWP21_00340 [Anabaenopsis sp. FSS-46]|uniref:hypothetical protein n=1 Tax=Anabaenopsis sp. FSS-46 TaxID=2971766 RepID=UPI0024745774|nr:hypothetical protein [Anabaenopsis sp. FSS-46]MDH6097319.1 hypothetical protein [Anabaenopsis sp. FSS-46]
MEEVGYLNTHARFKLPECDRNYSTPNQVIEEVGDLNTLVNLFGNVVENKPKGSV